ncbi:CHASE2 domain-containing protein [Methyloversatilis thermotolerans]|uniref:CHASE2 domain-containing protein n=1 Tax=Methyloversatilis thermotolerans TaxID=1346290 RepID=UPI00036C4F2C|nr:adenylate/guanylate cyclase domain-containing protein [Methyloversatilis thermotolerans]
MRQHALRYGLGLALILLLLGHAARFYSLPVLGNLDLIAYDTKLALTMPGTRDDRIAILDIDERSLAEVGRWPWGRERLATLLDRLFDHYGVLLLGVDVVFAEADTSSGLPALEALARGTLADNDAFRGELERLRPSLDHDRLFAAALKDRPVLLGYYFSDRGEGLSTGQLPEPVLPAGTFRGRSIAFARFDSFGANLPAFQSAALGAGHFNPLPDFDGLNRRVPMLVEYKGAYYESLSLAMVRTLLGSPKLAPGYAEASFMSVSPRDYAGLEWLELSAKQGTLRIPVDENVAALIPFRGRQGSFAYHSLADVLAGRTPVEALKGRIVLLGTTAPGLLDLRATPVSGTYPGVEIHANLIAGMLDGRIKHRPQYVTGFDVVVLALVGGLLLFLLPRLSPLRATGLSAVVLVLLVAMNFAFWQYADFVLPVAASLLMVAGLYALNMFYGYFVEARSKRQFARMFGQYVPPELVEEMSRNPEHYSMDARTAELTVMFSDVRGFTGISEGLEPRELTRLMNEYLGAMTSVIQDQRGTLDKYIGDAIMAFWGAPVDDADHAQHGVTAALHMQQRLDELNRSLTARGWPELKIGIGVNSGTMTVGDMGSPVRKAYTVLGDAVNLASRLEGLTKQYGVGILVGEDTRRAVKGIVFREIDRVRVKGKDEPVSIHEPLAFEAEFDRGRIEELKLWNQALRQFRAQEWDQAELSLFNLQRMAPDCLLYAAYAEQIGHYRRFPPGKGWDGVRTFETK